MSFTYCRRRNLSSKISKKEETSGRVDDSEEGIIRHRIEEYYAKTAEVAELYKQQGKYVEINGSRRNL